MKPPSTSAKASEFPSVQAKAPILNGRPFSTSAAPVDLYHPVFAKFKRRFKDKTLKVRLDIQAKVYSLCIASADLYKQHKLIRGELQGRQIESKLYKDYLNRFWAVLTVLYQAHFNLMG